MTNSPCVRNCCLNENDICLGCFRSLSEIVGWSGAGQEERKGVIERAAARRQAYESKVQGWAGTKGSA